MLLLLALAVDALLAVYVIYVLATLIPTYAVMARRLRDTGKSGWMIVIGVIPIVGFILLIVFLAAQGDSGRNQYGDPVPYGA